MTTSSSKILIAGGSGFIGSHIAAELWKAEKSLAILSRHPGDARQKLYSMEADCVRGDVRDPQTLPKAFEDVATLIIAVQFPGHPVENPSKGYTYENFDQEGTRNLVAAARASGSVKHIIYMSGAGVREDRRDLAEKPWFRAKVFAERAVRESQIPYTIFRPSWIYGREDRSLNRFVKMARTLPVIPVIGNGRNRVQPLFILDLAKIVAKSVDNPKAQNQVYEIGGPEILTMDEILQKILQVLGKHKPLVHHPVGLMKFLTAPLTLLPNPPLSPKSIEFIMMEELVENNKVMADFKLPLTPLSTALATYLNG